MARILSLISIALLATSAYAQQPDLQRAGLVIVHGDGRVTGMCVSFPEESISSAELLRRSGLEVALSGYGGLGYGVCAIEGEGCPADHDCFCQCRSTPCAYWVFSHRRPDGSWAISGVGASAWQVRDGDVDGWVWGDGSTAPPAVSFAQVCPSDTSHSHWTTRTSTPGLAPAAIGELPEPTITAAPLPVPAVSAPMVPPPTSPTSPAPTEAGGRKLSPVGHVIFGVVALGLAAWLVAASLRGRPG